MLHAQQGAENVGIEGGRVALGGLFRRRTRLAFGSGGVYSHIQATEARHGLIDQVSYLVLVTHVGIHVFRLRVEAAELSHQILAGFVASTRDNDARTLFREGQGGGSSNAREGAVIKTTGVFIENSSFNLCFCWRFPVPWRSTPYVGRAMEELNAL